MEKLIGLLKFNLIVLLGGAVMMSSCSQPDTQTKLIPREVLFGNPLRVSPQISPDGTLMSYLAPSDGVLNVWVKTIGSDDDHVVTTDTNRGIRIYFWGQNGKQIMYLQDVGGNENWRLYSVDLATDRVSEMTPFEDVRVQIVDHNKDFPNEMLIAMNKDNPQIFDVYHLDMLTGEIKEVAKNPGNIMGWVTDSKMKIRGAVAGTPDGGLELLLRNDESSPWKSRLTWDSEDALASGPVGFSKDGNFIYMEDSRNTNSSHLVKMELATGKIEVIAADPQYDISNVLINPDTKEVEAVSFAKARTEWQVISPGVKDDFAAIEKIDHGDIAIIDRDNADKTWIVGFIADNGPVSYYAFDRQTKQGTFLFHHRPELKEYTLATMEPISFTARDGMTIYGYITYPAGIKEPRNMPMVLNVHGGPWYRDSWGFNPEAQWMANRGYICLQVNFRGSVGYGKDYTNAGDREWGGKMHNDLVDAVQWAIDKGIADPKKVAIYGGSYGGYAALVGATFTPDLFNCAVDIVGPSNLMTWITSIPPYWSTLKAIFYRRIGNPETEADFLMSRSPITKVDQIKIPMLIAQGANDPRVKQNESEQIVKAMQSKGIDCQYMLFPDEGHGFAKPENRLKFYGEAEKFLSKYLGGRYEESASQAN